MKTLILTIIFLSGVGAGIARESDSSTTIINILFTHYDADGSQCLDAQEVSQLNDHLENKLINDLDDMLPAECFTLDDLIDNHRMPSLMRLGLVSGDYLKARLEWATKQLRLGNKVGKDRSYALHIGDSFDQGFLSGFKNPATLSFIKEAGKETAEALAFAIRLTDNTESKTNKQNVYGFSIEKNSSEGESSDIRSYHYARTNVNCALPYTLNLNYADNFKTGLELATGSVEVSLIYPVLEKKDNGCYFDFDKHSPDEFRTNTWMSFTKNSTFEYYVSPSIGLEFSDALQQPYAATADRVEDRSFLKAKIDFGIRRNDFEFIYKGTKRMGLSGDKDLTFHDYGFNWYLDWEQRFSIGISAKEGQRPIDPEEMEIYSFVIGYRL